MPNNCPIDLKPYAQSQEINLPQFSNVNYTNQDFWSLKSRMLDFINERFGTNGTVLPNTFNDFIESSVAIMLLEIYAFLGDTLSFKADQQFNEMFSDTVVELENAFRIAKGMGMQPLPPIAARSLWSATLNAVLSKDVVISTPIAINTSNNQQSITIELFAADSNFNPLFNDDIVIPAGSTSITNIVGLEGITNNTTFSGTGTPNQTFTLPTAPVIYGSVVVKVDGNLWNQVDYFTDSNPRREYRLEFDSNFNAYIIFGNNRNGLIPSVGSIIEVKYRIGGGTRGNIISNYITTQIQSSVESLGISVNVSLNNYTKGSYGYDGDGVDEIKRKLGAYLRTQDRAVTGLDYETIANQFSTPYHGKIGKSNAVLRNNGCAGNILDLYILAQNNTEGLEKASNDLKVDLMEEINKKKMISDYVCLKDGIIVYVDTTIDVVCDKFYKKFETEIKENIIRRVNAFFALNNWDFEQSLNSSDLIKQISDLNQLKSAEISFIRDDSDATETNLITAKFYEIIRPDNVDINFTYE